jgi:hypothetical protein
MNFNSAGSGLLGALGAVLGARLLTIFHALQIEGAANDVVTNAREILDPATTNEDDAVLLQVVAFTADIGDDLKTVGETNLGDLTQRGVRLLGGGGVDASANPATLGAPLHSRRFRLHDFGFPAVTHELVDGWHSGNLFPFEVTWLKRSFGAHRTLPELRPNSPHRLTND